MSKVFAFLKDESGATAIEYGLIAAGISVVIITSVNLIGDKLNAKFVIRSDAEPALKNNLFSSSCKKFCRRRLSLVCKRSGFLEIARARSKRLLTGRR